MEEDLLNFQLRPRPDLQNRAADEIQGFTQEQVRELGQNLMLALPPEEIEQIRRQIEQLQRQSQQAADTTANLSSEKLFSILELAIPPQDPQRTNLELFRKLKRLPFLLPLTPDQEDYFVVLKAIEGLPLEARARLAEDLAIHYDWKFFHGQIFPKYRNRLTQYQASSKEQLKKATQAKTQMEDASKKTSKMKDYGIKKRKPLIRQNQQAQKLQEISLEHTNQAAELERQAREIFATLKAKMQAAYRLDIEHPPLPVELQGDHRKPPDFDQTIQDLRSHPLIQDLTPREINDTIKKWQQYQQELKQAQRLEVQTIGVPADNPQARAEVLGLRDTRRYEQNIGEHKKGEPLGEGAQRQDNYWSEHNRSPFGLLNQIKRWLYFGPWLKMFKGKVLIHLRPGDKNPVVQIEREKAENRARQMAETRFQEEENLSLLESEMRNLRAEFAKNILTLNRRRVKKGLRRLLVDPQLTDLSLTIPLEASPAGIMVTNLEESQATLRAHQHQRATAFSLQRAPQEPPKLKISSNQELLEQHRYHEAKRKKPFHIPIAEKTFMIPVLLNLMDQSHPLSSQQTEKLKTKLEAYLTAARAKHQLCLLMLENPKSRRNIFNNFIDEHPSLSTPRKRRLQEILQPENDSLPATPNQIQATLIFFDQLFVRAKTKNPSLTPDVFYKKLIPSNQQ